MLIVNDQMTQNLTSLDIYPRITFNVCEKIDKCIPIGLPTKNLGKQSEEGTFLVTQHYVLWAFFSDTALAT